MTQPEESSQMNPNHYADYIKDDMPEHYGSLILRYIREMGPVETSVHKTGVWGYVSFTHAGALAREKYGIESTFGINFMKINILQDNVATEGYVVFEPAYQSSSQQPDYVLTGVGLEDVIKSLREKCQEHWNFVRTSLEEEGCRVVEVPAKYFKEDKN